MIRAGDQPTPSRPPFCTYFMDAHCPPVLIFRSLGVTIACLLRNFSSTKNLQVVVQYTAACGFRAEQSRATLNEAGVWAVLKDRMDAPGARFEAHLTSARSSGTPNSGVMLNAGRSTLEKKKRKRCGSQALWMFGG